MPSNGRSDGGGDARRPTLLRADRSLWPDPRTQAFALPPAVPHTADDLLAAGDAARAVARYSDALAERPHDPHLLSGWIVAHALHAPGPAARRMLARPELARVPGVSR
ncbi:hypothetical protein ACIRPX_33650 [Streptomyces sp. NPDC101225]|uniref:hypothetical protein n=1 Tax=Streptomyces sp. NPDC101225 TaxID=3366135 RepID=UPI0038192B00